MADKQTIEYLKQAASLKAKAKAEMEKVTQELMKQNKLSEAAARIEAKKDKKVKDYVAQLKEMNSLVAEQRNAQKLAIDNLMQQEQKLNLLQVYNKVLLDLREKK